jgi:uncharacterized protein YjaG (DUF416 family)
MMMLTVEEIIKQNKLFYGFTPFVEVTIKVKQLPLYHQIAFFCSCYERILPIYMLVDGTDGWGNVSILRSVGNDLWEIAGGGDVQEGTIAHLINKANEIFIEDNDENTNDDWESRQGLYVYFGEEVSRIARLVLEYIDTSSLNSYLEIFTTIIFVVCEYLDMYFANVVPNWGHKIPKDEAKAMLMNNSLMQDELHKELADLEFLRNTSELTPEILSVFRKNSCPKGLGILGSLDTVRANLEGI